MNELLDYNALDKLTKQAIDAELWETDKRRLLFFRIADLRGRVPAAGAPELQLRTDLQFLNVSAARDGMHPLLIWLQNARPLVADRNEQVFFENLLSKLEGRPGEASIPPALIAAVKNESILFQDDMLPIGYLLAGVAAGHSVARLLIPRYQNDHEQAKRYWGTGWLLTDSLMLTNHHVFNARDEGEPAAAAADFDKQALHATVEFDVDSPGSAAEFGKVTEVVCSDENLDYAIARIQIPYKRKPLAVDWSPFNLKQGDVVPLNIIQHPNGQPKKIAIRNNLATAAPSAQLRYFTSTLGGSSGAPVLNDHWKVVGIHRGSIGTKILNFQGRSTAMVNLGTQMAAILDSIPDALKAEIQG